jgi:hypothetical protein
MGDYQGIPSYPPPGQVYGQTSTMAIVSLIAGIATWVFLPIIGAIVAIITGHMSKNEIRASAGRLTGDGLATAGLVLGYIHLAFAVLGICAFIAMLALGITIPLCMVPFGNWQQ